MRRSIDGLWADQFIETCADWVIPYIGELVAAREVTGLDPRGQRLDVANTIRWRRRKGTLPTAAAVARGITGWDAHAVEGFRRLARTRHDLDLRGGRRRARRPGRSNARGRRSPTCAPDRRQCSPTAAFGDGYRHADLRRGNGTAGRFGPEKLIVYCWRLLTFEVTGATPVPVAGRPDEYVFDPTGREIPLFLPPAAVTAEAAARPWGVPGPLTAAVDRMMTEAGAPAAYQVTGATGRARCGPRQAGSGWPRPPPDVTVSYQHGFGGPIGAGTAALAGGRRCTPRASRQPVTGGDGLGHGARQSAASDTVTIADSLTYTAVADVACAVAPRRGGR